MKLLKHRTSSKAKALFPWPLLSQNECNGQEQTGRLKESETNKL